MRDIDYTGSTGGLMALAFGAGWAAATAMWMTIAGIIWRYFLDPRIKQLEEDHRADREKIMRLETVLLIHGSASVRRAMSAAGAEPADEAE